MDSVITLHNYTGYMVTLYITKKKGFLFKKKKFSCISEAFKHLGISLYDYDIMIWNFSFYNDLLVGLNTHLDFIERNNLVLTKNQKENLYTKWTSTLCMKFENGRFKEIPLQKISLQNLDSSKLMGLFNKLLVDYYIASVVVSSLPQCERLDLNIAGSKLPDNIFRPIFDKFSEEIIDLQTNSPCSYKKHNAPDVSRNRTYFSNQKICSIEKIGEIYYLELTDFILYLLEDEFDELKKGVLSISQEYLGMKIQGVYNNLSISELEINNDKPQFGLYCLLPKPIDFIKTIQIKQEKQFIFWQKISKKLLPLIHEYQILQEVYINKKELNFAINSTLLTNTTLYNFMQEFINTSIDSNQSKQLQIL